MGQLQRDPTQTAEARLTSHAMLVPWGLYAQRIGWIEGLRTVPVPQRTRDHAPQDKLQELFVAILSGCPYLQDISRGTHPLDQDPTVARAWRQEGWADYSGVSRALKACTPETVAAVEAIIEKVSRPFIDQEVREALCRDRVLIYDGDLTGRPVSNTSTAYPGVAYGWMDDDVRLGYQAALVSMRSPTYGRLWLSVKQHPGDTVPSTQVLAMVRAAEAVTRVRPRRRTELLAKRIADQGVLLQAVMGRQAGREARVAQARQQLAQAEQECRHWRQQVTSLEALYRAKGRQERPHSAVAQARRKLAVRERRLNRRQEALAKAECLLVYDQQKVSAVKSELEQLKQRLAQFEEDNRGNSAPIRAIFRLDGGFGSGANLALLIEMGYDVYTKAKNHQVVGALRRRTSTTTTWTRVGKNAEMVTWEDVTIANCPYPLDAGLERFQTGSRQKHAALLHYGAERAAQEPTIWFEFYNGRQTIEAGIKEGKSVLQMHHFKVRSAAGVAIQELFTAFGANFIRWAAVWLSQNSFACTPASPVHAGVKESVRIAANTSAWVTWRSQGCLLRFTDLSRYAGIELAIGNNAAVQLPLPMTYDFAPT